MEWNIRHDYDPGDETFHFGTRAYAESDGCIYEISTVATFQSENEVSETPSSLTFGYISNGGVCVCVGKTLTVFANESSSSLLFNFDFDGDIETFACSPDGNFLLVGLNNGFVHCLHIPSDGEAAYVKKLQTPPKGGRMFVKFIVDGSCPHDVLVVCASGIVVYFEYFNFQAMHSALLSGNSSELKELRSNISFSPLCGISSIAPIRSVSTLKWRDQITILAVGEGIATLSTGISSTPTGDSGEVKWKDYPSTISLLKLQATKDKGLFVALDATGQLVCLCPYTLKMRKIPQKNYKFFSDFQLIGDSASEAVIIAVTPSNDEEKCNLSMLTFSGLSEKFSLSVGRQCFLMSTSCNVEDIPFLDLGIDKASGAATISLKAATQTNPKFRLERLLTRKKFDAAEALAKNFGLDMSSVYMARAQCFLDQMQPWKTNLTHSPEENKKLLNTLISELDKIEDLDFISTCCVSAVPPDYFVAHSLLEYAQNRLEQFFVNNPELESKVSQLSANICSSLLRLETLNLLKCSWDVEEWLKFSRTDLLRDVQTFIRQGDLSEASIIWSRHKSSFKSSLDDEYIVIYLLEEIPAWVPLDKILEWLVHLLPTLLEVQPSCLPKIIAWMLSKISGLERSNPREWPKIGLDYAERMLNLMASQKIASPFLGVEVSPLRPLVVLRCGLADLYSLRSKYFIFLSLEDFTQLAEDVAITLLDSIDVGLISSFVSQYLNGFTLNHKLNIDMIIASYIHRVLQCSDGSWCYEEAPWELRIATLIPLITNYKIRLECINATLEAAPCPWSSVISTVAEDGLKLKHPMSSLIREKQKQISTNLILKKYGLNTHINKIDRQMLLKFIVKQNHTDMVSDIVELSQKSVDDYIIVIRQLYDLGHASKALELLKKLPEAMIVAVCPRLILTVSLSLDLPEVCNTEEDLEFLSAVAVCHETARALNPPGISNMEDLNHPSILPLSLEEIKNRFCLKRDFNKLLTVKEMANIQYREKALKEIVQDLLIGVVENEKPQERAIRLYHESCHAARLLLLPTALSLTEMIEQAMDLSDFELATYLVGCYNDLDNLSSTTLQRISRVPTLFLNKLRPINTQDMNFEVLKNASSAVYHVVSKVCCYCDTQDLYDTTKVLGWSGVWDFVSGQQEISSLGQRDPLCNWRFTALYKDPGLAGFMSGSHLNEFLCNAFSFNSKTGGTGEKFLSELPQSILKLRNDQHDLAVVIILSQLSCLKHNLSEQFCPSVEESFRKSCEVLLAKVSGARHFDKHLGLSLLACMGKTLALQYLQQVCKSAHMDFQRQKALSFLGTIVSDLWKVSDLHSQFKLMSLQSTWGLRLSELGIPAKELLRGKSDTEMVLHKLIGSKKVTPHLLRGLCSDYQLNLQAVLLDHLCAVLLSWDPDPIVTVNEDGSKDVIERNTHELLLDQCWEIQKHIKNKSYLCTTLVNTWAKVNFYHHEVFLVILDLLERHGVQEQLDKRLITTFLKNYRRIKPPDQAEEEFWSEVFPSSFGLPPMSEFRLPYNSKLTHTPLQVVRHEINLNTYKNWLSIAAALNLPKDKICTVAAHQSVTEEFSGYQNNLEWCGTLKNEALFESIAACVADMDNVEQAAATLYFFMNKIPAGLDQVAVANLCLQYAESVHDQTGNTEFKLKLEKKYIHLATLQTLHMYGLGQPSYLQLARNPTELISALYQHPTILKLCRGTSSHSLDINAVAEEICKLHSICIKTLHLNLVSEWLQPDIPMDCNTSMDEDCYRRLNNIKSKESVCFDLYSSDENILRARYVMEHGDVQEWAYFLIAIVYQGEASTAMRLRAMQCFCMLTEEETLEYLAGRPMSDIRKKLLSLAYLKDLEILGLTYSESGFDSCDKKELANLILRTQTQSPRAISLLVRLCIDFHMTNMSLWNSIFQQLVDLAMIKELEQALSHTSEMYHLWTVPSYSKAWNLLLTSPFTNANSNPDEDQKSSMFHAITLLPTCPVLKHIDVARALDHCLTNQLPEMAALLLPYIEKSLIPQLQEKIILAKNVNQLILDLKKIASEKCINISKILNMLSPHITEAS